MGGRCWLLQSTVVWSDPTTKMLISLGRCWIILPVKALFWKSAWQICHSKLLLLYHHVYVAHDPLSSKSSEEQMLTEDKLTYGGVKDRAICAFSCITNFISALLDLFILWFCLGRWKREGAHRSWTLLTYTCADSFGLFFVLTLPQAKQLLWGRDRECKVKGFRTSDFFSFFDCTNFK